MAATLLQNLAISEGAARGSEEKGNTENGFLNDLIANLWPNVNTAGCKMVKEMVEPMFKSMLPGPLKSLHFTKLDLGPVPIRFTEVKVDRTETQGVKLDMDVNWDAKCSIELDGELLPKLGVNNVKLNGRLSILMCPLTNILPCIGAIQIAFINLPTLHLGFTGAAAFADIGTIDRAICKVILDIIASMAVLPNRYLVKLDATNDYFQTYQHHLGVLRLTVDKLTGISDRKKTGIMKLVNKIHTDVPDCYCKVSVGAEKDIWRTSTQKNKIEPQWDETHDFLVMDHDQFLAIDVLDDDIGTDDDLGVGITSIKQILAAGGEQSMSLVHNGQQTPATLTLRAEYYHFVSDPTSLQQPISSEAHKVQGRIIGLVTILIDAVHNLRGDRDQLHPSVKVAWGTQEQRTSIQSYTAGVDIFNPNFDTPFRYQITPELLENPAGFKLTLMNKEVATGSVDVSFADVLKAQGMTVAEEFKIGEATVRAKIAISGTQLAKTIGE